jgi:hypothetical protein
VQPLAARAIERSPRRQSNAKQPEQGQEPARQKNQRVQASSSSRSAACTAGRDATRSI